jgi:hypothetical protein
MTLALLVGCRGGGAPPTPQPVPASTDFAAQARTTREACSALIERDEAMELVDFSTFTRAAEQIWDAAVRVRQRGALTRLGCRHNLTSNRTELFDPAAPPALPPGTVALATGGATAESKPAPEPPAKAVVPSTAPTTPAAVPASPPLDRLAKDLSWVPDSTARANIARVRDACLAEASRKKLAIESIDSFQRMAGSATVWEAALVSRRRGKAVPHLCTFDQATAKTLLR